MDARTKSNPAPIPLGLRLVILAVLTGTGLWFFPLWHIVSLQAPKPVGSAATLDVPAFAAKFWSERLQPACPRATDAALLAAALRRDPAAAIEAHAHKVGLGGTVYFFVRGEGRILAREKDAVLLALGDNPGTPIALQIGSIFGNAVRDGSDLLDVNEFPSLDEFNALSAELNRLVEARVLPALRDQARPGAWVAFAGCTEATEPVAGRPLVTLVPVFAEVR